MSVGVDPAFPPATTFEGRLLDRVASLERRLRTLEGYFSGGSTQQFPVVAALGPAGRAGRAVVLATDKKLYVDNGVAWVAQT